MGGFWFFTDVDRIANQTPGEAFGLVDADHFRVTDLHSAVAGASGPPRAYAICQGLIRARWDDAGGGLTLILKPARQPPFDFPHIAYFLYKGIDATSLLQGTLIDTAASNDLVDAIRASWKANNNTSPDPTNECLGLHLHQTTPAAAGFDPTLYGIGKPLDNLFYRGDGRFPAVLVNAGDHLGDFLPTAFGLEVVIGRIAQAPPIEFAHKRVNIISARVTPTGTLPPNHAEAFMSRHEREAILDFVDPCAFWGSFLLSGLRAKGVTGGPGVKGDEVYAKVLDAKFVNRNKAYIDIRDDHGHSMNYYRATGDAIQLTLDPVGDPVPTVNYYDQGWPSFSVPTPSTALPTDDSVAMHVALPAVAGSSAITYVSSGYARSGKKLARLGDRDRWITRLLTASGFPELARLTLPLVQAAGVSLLHASYHKLHQFRRTPIVDPQATPPADSAAPFWTSSTGHLYPMSGAEPFPRSSTGCTVRTYSDLVLVPWSAGGLALAVARPGVARDANNTYLFLLPVAAYDASSAPSAVAFPTIQEFSEVMFAPDVMLDTGKRLAKATIHPDATDGALAIELAHERFLPTTNRAQSANFWAIAIGASEFMAIEQAVASALLGTATISLTRPSPGTDSDMRRFEQISLTLSYLSRPTPSDVVLARVSARPVDTVYRDAPA